jgi:hypothetical protein
MRFAIIAFTTKATFSVFERNRCSRFRLSTFQVNGIGLRRHERTLLDWGAFAGMTNGDPTSGNESVNTN